MPRLLIPELGCPQVEEDPTGGKFAGVGGALNSAHHKLEDVIQFHVGDTVTALQRAAMQPGGQEAIIYGTIMGALGVPCLVTAFPCCDFMSQHSPGFNCWSFCKRFSGKFIQHRIANPLSLERLGLDSNRWSLPQSASWLHMW